MTVIVDESTNQMFDLMEEYFQNRTTVTKMTLRDLPKWQNLTKVTIYKEYHEGASNIFSKFDLDLALIMFEIISCFSISANGYVSWQYLAPVIYVTV